MALRLKTFSSLLFSYDKQCVTTVLFRSKHKKSQNDKESAPIKKSLSKEEYEYGELENKDLSSSIKKPENQQRPSAANTQQLHETVYLDGENSMKKSDASEDFWFKSLSTVKKVERKIAKNDQALNDQSDWFKTLTNGNPTGKEDNSHVTKINKNENEQDLNDQSDWFTSLTSKNATGNEEGFQVARKLTTREKLANCKTKEEKRAIIEKAVDFAVMNDMTLPRDLTEEEWDSLMECSSLNRIKFSLLKIAKERYYALQKAEKRALRLERLEEIQTKIDAGLWTTTDFRNSFVRKTTKTDERHFFRDRLASAVINNNPSIVFDFRYEHYFDRPNLMASLYRQYIEVISKNRLVPYPFQIYFCNYNPENIFNKKYSQYLELERNMIESTSKSYTDIFPKENLVYLSKDSDRTLRRYDPERVYIIGNIIDSGDKSDSYASYTQAKKDGIECMRLPIDENIKWQSGSKNLAMNHVFNLMLNAAHGVPWHESFKSIIPSRFINIREDSNQSPNQLRYEYFRSKEKFESFENVRSRKNNKY